MIRFGGKPRVDNPQEDQGPGPTKPSLAGGFWSAQKIIARHLADKLFWLPNAAGDQRLDYELDTERLRGASYNLKMGGEAYISPVSDSDPKSVRQLKPDEAFRIPPGQFAFLLTNEAVCIPDDAIALVALRARELQFKGLINVSGFHVDPGYDGRLVLAVYNAGPGEVHLREGDTLFEVFFADLDQPTNRPYRGSQNKKPLFRIEPAVISGVAGQFETLKGLRNRIDDVESDLDERIHSVEREQSITRWASALILGALITFGVKECTAAKASAPIESGSHE